jgi:hypothetical protein
MAKPEQVSCPELRKFEHHSSYAYTVGADHEFLQGLHRRLTDRASSGLTAKQLRDDLAQFAAQIRAHVEWLNKHTAAHEAEELRASKSESC